MFSDETTGDEWKGQDDNHSKMASILKFIKDNTKVAVRQDGHKPGDLTTITIPNVVLPLLRGAITEGMIAMADNPNSLIGGTMRKMEEKLELCDLIGAKDDDPELLEVMSAMQGFAESTGNLAILLEGIELACVRMYEESVDSIKDPDDRAEQEQMVRDLREVVEKSHAERYRNAKDIDELFDGE